MFFATFPVFLASTLALVDAAPTRLLPIIKRATNDDPSKPTSYIVALKQNTVDPLNRGAWLDNIFAAADASLSEDEKSSLHLGWNETTFNGLAGMFNADALNVLRAHEHVEYVQESVTMKQTDLVHQSDATWGVARLSRGSKHFPPGSDPSDNFDFVFDDSAGEGTDVYILDTGIFTSHDDFGGRADLLKSFIKGEDNTTDLDGHGTHCAGTVGGAHFGVAKRALLHGIKVLAQDGTGADSTIISGIDFAVKHAKGHGRPSVFSLSLGGSPSPGLDDAIRNAIKAGITVVVAAGNGNEDASLSSPSRVNEAIVVGAVDINDNIASFSNFGSLVDVFAPGVKVTSAGIKDNKDTNTLSGTSMACPHISGLAAAILSREGAMTPARLEARIKQLATASIVGNTRKTTTSAIAFNGVVFQSR